MTDTRWLAADEQRAWRAYIDGSSRLADRLDRELRERHGLTLAEYEILVRLSEESDHRLRMADLARVVTQSRSRLSHTVARLERDDYVRRERCAEDGRGVWAVLTGSGHSRLSTAAADHVASVRRYVVDALSPGELAAVGDALAKIDARLAGADVRPGTD